MNSLRRKTIVLRPILGMSPGFALAVVVCIVAVGVFAAVMLDDISRGAKKSPSVVSATNANFEQPAATIDDVNRPGKRRKLLTAEQWMPPSSMRR